MLSSCYNNGRKSLVVLKAAGSQESTFGAIASFTASGSVMECPHCGIIYREREHWFGNEGPERSKNIHMEVSHMWPGTRTLQGTHNAARKVLEGVSALGEIVHSATATPKKVATDWIADQVRYYF